MTRPALGPASLARNVFSNWFILAAGVCYTLVVTPYVVRGLGKELYGAWSFLNGLLAYSDVLYFGLGSAVVRHVAQCRARDDQGGINRIASVVLLIYGLLGSGCFLMLAGASQKIPSFLGEPLTQETSAVVSLTCIVLGAQLASVFVGSAFAGILCGYDRFDLVNVVNALALGGRFVAIPLVVDNGTAGLVNLALVMAVSAACVAVGLAFLARTRLPGFRVRLAAPTLAELRYLYGFGLQSFVVIFSIRLINYTDTTVVGVILGASAVGVFSLAAQLVEYSRQVVYGFAGVFLPRLTGLVTAGDRQGLQQAYLDQARFACFLTGWFVATLVSIGPAFLNTWIGQEFGSPVRMVLLFLGIATFGQVLSTHVALPFYQALHIVAFPAAILLTEALLNLGLSIWLAREYGISGVALATAVPAVLLSAVVLPPYLCRHLGVPVRTMLMQSVRPGLLLCLLALLLYRLGDGLIPGESYLEIGARMACTMPLALAIFATTFPREQRTAAWALVRFWRRTP